MSRRINSVTRYFVFIALVLAAASGSLMAQQAVPTGWADFTKMFDTAMERDRLTGTALWSCVTGTWYRGMSTGLPTGQTTSG